MRTQVTTIFGMFITLFGVLSQPDIIGLFPARWSAIVGGAGIILTALGRSLLAPTNAVPGNVKRAEIETAH